MLGVYPFYHWTYGDGNGINKTNLLATDHKYDTYGRFRINVEANNPVSKYSDAVKILVHKPNVRYVLVRGVNYSKKSRTLFRK